MQGKRQRKTVVGTPSVEATQSRETDAVENTQEEQGVSAQEEQGVSAQEEQRVSAQKEQGVSAQKEQGVSAQKEQGVSAQKEQGVSAQKEQGVSDQKEQGVSAQKEQRVSDQEKQEVEVKPKICCSARLLFTIIAFFSIFNLSFLRIGISMALVCIIVPEGKTPKKGDITWNSAIKGYIISAAFYGFLIGPFLGGILSFKIGGKLTLIIGSLGCGLLHFILPHVIHFIAAFFGLRVAVGILAGFTFPCVYDLFSHWIVPEERQLLVTAALVGLPAASIINFPSAAFICDYFGWIWLFYAFAIWLVLFGIVCIFCLFNYPDECPYISKEERVFLQRRMPKHLQQKIPWKDILKSLPIYAYIIIHFCVNYVYLSMIFSLPLILKNLYHFPIRSNGLLSSLPFLGSFVMRIMMSIFFERIRSKLKLSRNIMRKGFVLLGALLTSGFLLLVVFLSSYKYWALTSFVLASTTLELCLSGGYLLSLLDLCPPYVNVLTGIANAIANVSGLICPVVNGFVTTHNTAAEWSIVFYINISVLLFATVVYLVFGKNDIQYWALGIEVSGIPVPRPSLVT